jgi:hypothetical protein
MLLFTWWDLRTYNDTQIGSLIGFAGILVTVIIYLLSRPKKVQSSGSNTNYGKLIMEQTRRQNEFKEMELRKSANADWGRPHMSTIGGKNAIVNFLNRGSKVWIDKLICHVDGDILFSPKEIPIEVGHDDTMKIEGQSTDKLAIDCYFRIEFEYYDTHKFRYNVSTTFSGGTFSPLEIKEV